MPTRRVQTYLEDILKNSDAIAEFLIGFDLPAYRRDHKTKAAVERKLQNLTEAAFRLGESAEVLCPEVNWRDIRGLDNVLRHRYDDLDDTVIWEAIHVDLPTLRRSVQRVLADLGQTSEGDPL